MVKELLRYGAQIAPRMALAFGAFAVMLTSQVKADHIVAPAPCAPECAVPEVPCEPTCETPAPCTPDTCTPESCTPETCTDDGCAPTTCEGDEDEGPCGLIDCFDDECGNNLFKDAGINFGGWTQLGYHTDSNGLFNNVPNNVRLQQQWLYIEKVADGSEGLDWGFRFDLMYGTDGSKTQAFGNPPGNWDFQNGFDHGIYSWAIPQAYVEVASGDLSVIAGHFFTLIGYEVVTAPDNFFYSHAYTMFNSEPFTHTGVLATYSASDDVTVYGGWTLGWDTGFDQLNGGSNFLGGVSTSLTEDITATYITTIGNMGQRGKGYSHSIVLDVALTEDLNYVFQSDLVELDDSQNAAAAHQFSVNQYLFYSLNDTVSVGGRAEWWKNGGNSQYEVTMGVNVKPMDNLIIRPEVRHDWNPSLVPGVGNNFTTFGCDVILTY